MLEHAKILQRVFEKRIRNTITLSDIQMGFMPGKSTVDAIFAVSQSKATGQLEKIFS